MAKILDNFPGRSDVGFPWREWLNGRVWELEPADLKGVNVGTFISLARRTAKQEDKLLHTKQLKNGNVIIQSYVEW